MKVAPGLTPCAKTGASQRPPCNGPRGSLVSIQHKHTSHGRVRACRAKASVKNLDTAQFYSSSTLKVLVDCKLLLRPTPRKAAATASARKPPVPKERRESSDARPAAASSVSLSNKSTTSAFAKSVSRAPSNFRLREQQNICGTLLNCFIVDIRPQGRRRQNPH